ncbi:MAG: DUF4199 domain-containing protein [Ferruginibacter sp.]
MKNLDAKYKGIITGLLMIVLSVVFFYAMKLPVNGRNQFLILVVFIAGLLWTLISFKQHAPDTAGFKEYFSEGFKNFIVVAFMMAVFTFVFYKLNPQIMEDGIKENNILVMKEGNHTDAEINANADKLRSIFMPMMLTINTFKYLLLGSIISIVAAGFLKKRDA